MDLHSWFSSAESAAHRYSRTRMILVLPNLFLLSGCIALSFPAHAQTPQPQLQTRPPADNRLFLDVIAPTRNGSPAEPPSADSLRVRIDGKQVPAASLTVTHPAAQLMFVLDAINTPRADLVRSQQALLTWLHNAGERLSSDTSILLAADTQPTFKGLPSGSISTWELLKNELYVTRIPPSRNPAELAAKLAAYNPGLSRLGEAADAIIGSERVHISLQALSFVAAAMKDSPAPKLMLWISPGWPYTHMTEGGYASQLFDSIVYFDDALRSARLMLYMLDPTGAATDHPAPNGDALLAMRPGALRSGGPAHNPGGDVGSGFYKTFLDPVRSPRDADPNDMVLPVLAIHSGGAVQTMSNDLLGGIVRFAADAAAVFELSFPAPSFPRKTSYKNVEISQPALGGVLRTRTGFYAP